MDNREEYSVSERNMSDLDALVTSLKDDSDEVSLCGSVWKSMAACNMKMADVEGRFLRNIVTVRYVRAPTNISTICAIGVVDGSLTPMLATRVHFLGPANIRVCVQQNTHHKDLCSCPTLVMMQCNSSMD